MRNSCERVCVCMCASQFSGPIWAFSLPGACSLARSVCYHFLSSVHKTQINDASVPLSMERICTVFRFVNYFIKWIMNGMGNYFELSFGKMNGNSFIYNNNKEHDDRRIECDAEVKGTQWVGPNGENGMGRHCPRYWWKKIWGNRWMWPTPIGDSMKSCHLTESTSNGLSITHTQRDPFCGRSTTMNGLTNR